jgi:Tfp pilus assembly protein PilN
MNEFLQQLITGNRFGGLEVEILPEGLRFHFVVLKRNKKTFLIEKQGAGLDSLDLLVKEIGKEIPVALCITGKGVLYRRIPFNPDATEANLLSRVLPNASASQFFMQQQMAREEEQYLSLLRRETALDILQKLAPHLTITSCHAGPLVLAGLKSVLPTETETILSSRYGLSFEGEWLRDIVAITADEETSLEINDQEISRACLIALAAAHTAFSETYVSGMQHIVELEKSKEEFLEKKKFGFYAKCLLASALLVLLGNYFIFSHYWEQQSMLEEKLSLNGSAYKEVKELETELASKSTFLKASGFTSSIPYSYCADRLAACMPEEIQLHTINLAPKHHFSESDTIGFDRGTIEVSGACRESVVLNSWIQLIQKQDWVESAVLVSYVQNKSALPGEFSLLIKLY